MGGSKAPPRTLYCILAEQFIQTDVVEPPEEEGTGGIDPPEKEGTRNYPRFDISHTSFLHFQRYLTGPDGGSRSEKRAKEMAVDVSKFLRYACGSYSFGPEWDRLTDRDHLIGYLEKLKRSSVRPEGQLAKLDAFCSALTFFKVSVLKGDISSPFLKKAAHMLDMLHGWTATLRHDKRKLRKKRLEELSCQDLSLDEVNLLVENIQLWKAFALTCTRVQRGESLHCSSQ